MCDSPNKPLTCDLKQAQKELVALRDLVNKLTAEHKDLQALIILLQERNKELAEMLFGAQSEKINKVASSDPQSDDSPPEEDNGSATSNDVGNSDTKDSGNGTSPSGKNSDEQKRNGKKRGGRKPFSKDLPRVQHRLSFKTHCDKCKSLMRIINSHFSEKLAVLPVLFYVIVYEHTHTACPCCDDQIACTKAEPSLIPNSQTTPELLAHMALSKAADGLPIYRQEKQANRSGCPMSRDKLNRWFVQLGFALRPLVKVLGDVFNRYSVGSIDETRLQVINEPGKTAYQLSYLFVRYGGPPNKPVMLVDYAQNKNQETVDALLDPFEGHSLVSDMYAAFIAFVKARVHLTLYACHDHIRRKFVKALKQIPKAVRHESIPDDIIHLYTKIYRIERLSQGRSPRVIKRMRRKSRRLLNKLYNIIESIKVTPKSTLGKAVSYAIAHKTEAYAYLDNPLAPISNIMSEHVAKKIAVARKNFLFCVSVQGAQALANIMTLVYTAELYPQHNLHDYLTIVFAELPKAETVEDLEALMPWSITPEQVAERISIRPRPEFSNFSRAA